MLNPLAPLPVCGRPHQRRGSRGGLTPALARTDPAAFLRECLADPQGNAVELAPVHEEVQAFLSAHRMALIELPRDHGKSFQVCGRLLWELGREPGLRVKVVCATEGVAAERSRFLRDAIAKNPNIGRVFPHLRPGSPWTAAAFAVGRPAEAIGPSVAAFGVGAGTTGTRADLLVCDDVVDVRALHSRAERARTADFFTNNLMNLLEPDGRCWGLCTPWHPDDLNARLKANPAFAVFRRAIGPDFEPVWPAKWPAERLRERRAEIGAASFARGYHLLPVAEGETPIRPEWVRTWTEPAACETVVGIKDLLVRHARFGPRVKGVSQSADKAARVAAFSVAVENGGFLLMGERGAIDAGQRELFDEMTAFPFGDRDDLLDAAATGCAYLLDRRDPRAW